MPLIGCKISIPREASARLCVWASARALIRESCVRLQILYAFVKKIAAQSLFALQLASSFRFVEVFPAFLVWPTMAYHHGIDAEIVAQGRAILDDKAKSIGEIKDDFLDFCVANNLATTGVVHTEETMTHPRNRGSLVLNPNNAHRNGSMIRRVGANVLELHGAVAMEMSPDPAKRQETALVD